MSISKLSEPSRQAASEGTLSAQANAIAEIAQGVAQIGNGLAAIGHGVAEVGQTMAPLQDLIEPLNAALQDVQRRQAGLGGIFGLLRLLRDKELQRTIHLLTILPAFLDRLGHSELTTSDPKGAP